MTDILRDSLRELTARLQPHDIRLTIVGGYGLILRVEAIQASGVRTRGGLAPVSRSTADIDCYLGAALISDGSKAKRLRDTLNELGYVAATEHLLFERKLATEHGTLTMRLDLMAAPIEGDLSASVKITERRIRSKEYANLHGRLTPEAVFVEDGAMEIDISHDRSGLMVNLPQAFSYLVMKLYALRDGPDSKDPGRAHRHALDMFTIWTTITEPELAAAVALRQKYARHPVMAEARRMTAELFSGRDAAALLSVRIAARDSGIRINEALLPQFAQDIVGLLGDSTSTGT